jgi:hypothetical protein
MSTMIRVRHVADAIHRKLEARAAEAVRAERGAR